VTTAATAFAQGYSFKWWQQERFQKELKLSPDQITKIESIFQALAPIARSQKQAIDRHEEKLSKVIADEKSDEAAVLEATDRLELARNEMTRTRTLMLFRIRRVLSAEQVAKLNEMHDHDRKDRDRKDNNKKQQ
jgi:Spy/CpxP family protein refolding chaperone